MDEYKGLTATYSPDDNKLRLYAISRLPADLYERVKAHGFRWAPKQDLFVAPMWTPKREDFLIELCGEIGDEDKSLVERQEERAERFEEYSDKRRSDADSAHRAVDSISQRFEAGQPILIGHHSQKRAERDRERMDNNMRRAVKMWETSKYWTDRAQGALAHARYKELPAVRARRIKTIEADKRKQERDKKEAAAILYAWELIDKDEAWKAREDGTMPDRLQRARVIANKTRLFVTRETTDGANDGSWQAYDVLQPDGERYQRCPAKTPDDCLAAARRNYEATAAWCDRWIAHYNNRLIYERAMLAEQGGLAGEKFDYQPGGKVKRRGDWFTVLKINRRNGELASLTVAGHWKTTVSLEEIQDYKPPEEGAAERVANTMKPLPLCNYPGEGFRHMTEAEFKDAPWRKWSDSPKTKSIKETETHEAHKVRYGQPEKREHQFSSCGVYLTDKPRKDPPAREFDKIPPPVVDMKPERDGPPPVYKPREEAPEDAKFKALKEIQRTGGVQVVVADQLFPTPPDIAARMVELADIEDGHRVLEPSAGTGNILRAIRQESDAAVVAIEINPELARVLSLDNTVVRCADFLTCVDETGFDRIVMNPPFKNGEDIKHIMHAAGMLKPGGVLVALCANGPRQNAALAHWATQSGGTWEVLPEGSFSESGTGVNVAMLSYIAPQAEQRQPVAQQQQAALF